MQVARPDTVKFHLKRYDATPQEFENELVAQLPGLVISQFDVPKPSHNGHGVTGLRFDFVEDWYSIVAYLDETKSPTGYYDVSMQSPLHHDGNVWKGILLVLCAEVEPGWQYAILNEEEFIQAVEDGWMRVFAAAKARAALRDICKLLDEHCLPQEVMDALNV
jgi:predicted RNA-binding protein associated with RNAse of E/G family